MKADTCIKNHRAAVVQSSGTVTALRGGGLRISPHFYNTEAELLRVGAALDQAQ